MRKKLLLLFRYFESFRAERVNTWMNIDYRTIEDCQEEYSLDGISVFDETGTRLGSTTKYLGSNDVLESINRILEEIVESKMKEFHRWNNYEWDEYWSLDITIFPKQKRIKFRSECKEKSYTTKLGEFKIQDLEPPHIRFIEEIQKGESQITGYEETAKIEYNYDISYDYHELNDFEFDNQLLNIGSKENEDVFFDIVDALLTKTLGRWYQDENSVDGDITIMGKDIFLNYRVGYLEYEWTDMDINLTINDF